MGLGLRGRGRVGLRRGLLSAGVTTRAGEGEPCDGSSGVRALGLVSVIVIERAPVRAQPAAPTPPSDTPASLIGGTGPLQVGVLQAQVPTSLQKHPELHCATGSVMYWHELPLPVMQGVPVVGLLEGQPGVHGEGPFICQLPALQTYQSMAPQPLPYSQPRLLLPHVLPTLGRVAGHDGTEQVPPMMLHVLPLQ